MVEVKQDENNGKNGESNAPVGNSGGHSGGGGSKTLEPEQFRKLFIGELLDCVVMRDGQTKKSRGFGFVSFSSKEEVDRAMEARPTKLMERQLTLRELCPETSPAIREDHTEEAFNNYFSGFGKVVKVEVITDKATEKPRGFAFVTFDDHDPVDKCVLQKSHMISNYRCDVKKALSKDDIQRSGPWSGGRGGGGGGYGGGRDGGYGGGNQSWGGPPPEPGLLDRNNNGELPVEAMAVATEAEVATVVERHLQLVDGSPAAAGPPQGQWAQGGAAPAAGGWGAGGGGGAWSSDASAGGWGAAAPAAPVAGQWAAPAAGGGQWPAGGAPGPQRF
uniref:RRM domain-containing protein n=1 Tax=Ditylenchus dipsaci TaxID=166011 RepID=A0A915EIU9_9BILA